MEEIVIIIAQNEEVEHLFKDGKIIYGIDEVPFIEKKNNIYIKEKKPTDELYEIVEQYDMYAKIYIAIHLRGGRTLNQYKDDLKIINGNIKENYRGKLKISYYGSSLPEFGNNDVGTPQIIENIKSLVDNEAQENAEQIKFFYAEQKESMNELIKHEKNDILKDLYNEFIRQVGVLEIKYNKIITEINK